ncbi:LacI family DNA-binding transcriptional regulator [Clostridium sp. BJN0001]|uniref:LacI family DNA-binding transcriptional regulator n=1 Tax=Clostridium sp. BJN0001 TaxID=2930219 RepID=UPI001FD26F12|nr:LacI family DNA-binding transcriptional regulator [Clostridium sp. BJN0001]
MNIKDIAKLANVGVSTVSRVINNSPDVKESTREKIKNVIKKYNYVPNNGARMLKQNRTKNIGLLVKGVFNPFFSEMTSIIGSEIVKNGYSMIMEQNDFTRLDDVDTLISFIKEKKLRGAICLGGNFVDINNDSFNEITIPLVLASVDSVDYNDGGNYSSIGIDNRNAGYEATKYLIKNGHKKIAIIIGDYEDRGISLLRLEGYKRALKESKIKEEYILNANYSSFDAYDVTKEFLKKNGDSVTAIFALSDIMAMGVAKAVLDSNYKIPQDISILGFDGMAESKFYNPEISTVEQPKGKMAKASIELLFSLIDKKSENKHMVLKTKIIERSSVLSK